MASMRSAVAVAGVGLLGAALAFGPTLLEVAGVPSGATAQQLWGLATATQTTSAPAATATAAPKTPALAAPKAAAPKAAAPKGATPKGAAPKAAAPKAKKPAVPNPWPTMAIPAGVPAPAQHATHDGGKPIAYLTFDDGPDAQWTPQILSALAAHRARATFFVIGEEVARNPGLVRQIRGAGHTIGNHSYTHPWLTKLAAPQVTAELARTDALLGGTTCLRPPGGFVDAAVGKIMAARGSVVELWDTDTRDWARPGAKAIAATAVSQLRPGVVVLMHDGGGDRSQTVQALGKVLSDLDSRGYVVRPLPSCR